MRVSMKFTVAILIAALAMSGFALSTSVPAAAGEPVRYVLLSENNALPAHITELIEAMGGRVVSSVAEIGMIVVKSSDPAFLEAASALPGIAGGAPDRIVPLGETPHEVTLEGMEGVAFEALPGSGRFYPYQWSVEAIGAKDAFAAGYAGDPRVRVAVLDTGIDYRHQDLFGKIDLVNSRSFWDEPWPNGTPAGAPWPNGAPRWLDIHGHGTAIAGIIAGKGYNVTGVAPGVTLIAVKVGGRNGGASLATVAEAIVYAANLGVDVINMSFGETVTREGLKEDFLKQALWRAVNLAHARGAFMASSAGNEGVDWDDQDHRQLTKAPAQLNHVVGVSGTGPFMGIYADALSVFWLSPANQVLFTDYGKSIVMLAAPGGSRTPFARNVTVPNGNGGSQTVLLPVDWVLSTCALVLSANCSGGRGANFWVGTSMASAHVAGAAALIDSAYGGRLTGDQILALLKRGAMDLDKPGFDEFYGHGRINVYRSLTLNK